MVPHSSVLAWRIHGQRSLAGYSPRGRRVSDTAERLTLSLFFSFFHKKGKLLGPHYSWADKPTCHILFWGPGRSHETLGKRQDAVTHSESDARAYPLLLWRVPLPPSPEGPRGCLHRRGQLYRSGTPALEVTASRGNQGEPAVSWARM